MTPSQAMSAPLFAMDEKELQYVMAFCDGEVRRCVEWGSGMNNYESRRAAAETELWHRKQRKMAQR